jgi:hypothetical protein
MASCHGILLFNLLGLQEEFMFKAKHKPKYQAHTLLKLRDLFIGSTQVLEALRISEKSLLSLLVQVRD